MLRACLVLLTLTGCGLSVRDLDELNRSSFLPASQQFNYQAQQNLANSSNYRIPSQAPISTGYVPVTHCTTVGAFVSCR